MTLPVTILTWGGAAAPVIVLLILLVIVRWSAVRAAIIAMTVAILAAVFLYRASWSVISIEIIKGLWNSLSIMVVIFPAVLLYEISRQIKAFQAIQYHLTLSHPLIRVPCSMACRV